MTPGAPRGGPRGGPGGGVSRILLALPSVGLGGTERHSAVLAAALAAAGVAVTVALAPPLAAGFAAMLETPGGTGGRAEGRAAVRLQPAPLAWRPDASAGGGIEAAIRAQAAALAPVLAAVRPDLVLLPLPWPDHGLGLFQAVIEAGLPALAIHHLAPREPEPPLPAAALSVTARLAAAPLRFAAVSAPVAARAAARLGLPAARFAVVPNGVPVPPEDPALRAAARARLRGRLGLPPGARLLLFAGRLEWEKGADLLPGIAARLRTACDATLVALGDGSLRETLRRSPAAREAALRLPGHVADAPDWMLAADALLLPSRLEGCPLVFLEAAARRCPVIASGDAMEGFGEEADRLAAIAPNGGITDLTALCAVRLNNHMISCACVESAYRLALATDQAAMLRRYASLIRAAFA
ncbi:glycosyltransferase [Roseicella sp. DB1501]|uniref:glycosyltransferase n=1 Tax=Roseicella sp. DB1501 TaxID=2730925 RepID=UPI001491BDEA|nr:glycosyltransferase family 4 protein [Roseicella sp. DB1501]